ncbi:hypothetical protein B0H16DRAFT_512331 [Mycena metata]|uniref:Uncharacterized protein n=1 Tax=Mycena metata TaxID=1033252 RepID=A0AAD7H966_9AGAR|nr:hypothetical protein B0H16DRAFT_512331 [Mycena metata]
MASTPFYDVRLACDGFIAQRSPAFSPSLPDCARLGSTFHLGRRAELSRVMSTAPTARSYSPVQCVLHRALELCLGRSQLAPGLSFILTVVVGRFNPPRLSLSRVLFLFNCTSALGLGLRRVRGVISCRACRVLFLPFLLFVRLVASSRVFVTELASRRRRSLPFLPSPSLSLLHYYLVTSY